MISLLAKCFFFIGLFLETFSWKIKMAGTNLKDYFEISLPESIYIPRPRKLHSAVLFTTWTQNEMNQLCPKNYCGPLCQTSSPQCDNPYSTPSFNYSQNQYTIKNYSIPQCDTSECCGDSLSCERMYNMNGDLLTKSAEEVLLIFGGLELLNNLEEYGEESDGSCYKDFSRSCSQMASNSLYFYFIKRNLWIKVSTRAHPEDLKKNEPYKRYAHAASKVSLNFTSSTGRIYRREFMYIYGGVSTECNRVCSDLWVYEIPFAAQKYYPSENQKIWNRANHWKSIDSTNGPGPRAFHKMIYFEKVNCIYLFGGVDDSEKECNDLWEFNVETKQWKEIKALGIKSIVRSLVLWDGKMDSLIVPYEFYKADTDKKVMGEKPLGPCNRGSLLIPECRSQFSFELDQVRKEMAYLFGGYRYDKENKTEIFFSDLWEFNFTNFEWKKIIDTRPSSYIAPTPSSRRGSSISVAHPYIYIYGGANANFSLTDFWALNLNSLTWSSLGVGEIFNENSNAKGSLEVGPWPSARHSHTMSNSSFGLIIYGGVELYIPSRLLVSSADKTLASADKVKDFASDYKLKCDSLLSTNGISNSSQTNFLSRTFLLSTKNSSCFREFPSLGQFYLSSRYPTNPWVLSEKEACDPAYFPVRGRCFMGRMYCTRDWFGNQCQNKICENSFCYSNMDSLSPATCVFCSSHGECSQDGVCKCDKSYTGSDCSIVDCPNSCSNNETVKVADCIIEYPKSNCRCKDPLKRGGDDCGKVFCLNTCGKDGDSETGVCDENGNCLCSEKELKNYTGPDCSIMRVDILEYGMQLDLPIILMLAAMAMYL